MSGRFGLYPGDSRTVWESRHICIILVDSQRHYLPEAGRFICNRISLNGVDNVACTFLYWKITILIHVQGRGRRLLNFSCIDHPTKSDVTSGLNCAVQLVSLRKKMAFRYAKIFFYLQPIRFVSFQTEGRKMLQAHSFDFESKTFGKRQHFIIVLKENN